GVAQVDQVDRAQGRDDAAARHWTLLPRPGPGSLPRALALFPGERRHPEDVRGLVAGDDPAHGVLGHRHHRASVDRDAGERARARLRWPDGQCRRRWRRPRQRRFRGPPRRPAHLHTVPSGGADAPGGACLAQELHPDRGARGAAPDDPGPEPAWRDAAAGREAYLPLMIDYPTIEDTIGATPLVKLVRIPQPETRERGIVVLGKLEGNNPAGSVKGRPA